jgi:hypothetical protein
MIPIVIKGWQQEATPFETLVDPTPSNIVYENVAMDMYAKLEK